MQLDVEVSPPANDLQMGSLQIPKAIKVMRTGSTIHVDETAELE